MALCPGNWAHKLLQSSVLWNCQLNSKVKEKPVCAGITEDKTRENIYGSTELPGLSYG